jgi:copper homeostasis protein
MLLELATFKAESVLIAERIGVGRLELCEDYSCGGLTPSMDYFKYARENFSRDIFVMIRPRTGGYVFTDAEFEGMLEDVSRFRDAGANGFVCGFFQNNEEIHRQQLVKFVDVCQNLPVTFHRSFDDLSDWKKGLELLIDSGCKRLLTSGDGANAFEGRKRLREMVDYAHGRLIILPGGGIRSTNIKEIISEVVPVEVHTAALSPGISEVADELELNKLLQLLNKSSE